MIDVTAAILVNEGKILIAKRRSGGKLPDVWEFPGGKIEGSETPRQCLKREMQEEFGIGITVGDSMGESVYHYEHGSIRLLAFRASWESGNLHIRDHAEIQWITADQLCQYEFAPADMPFVEKLQRNKIVE